MPRWLYAALGFAVSLTLVVGVPAIRAAAEDGDNSSPTPAATTEATTASVTPKAEPSQEAPSPKPSTNKPDPTNSAPAPAPKPSASQTKKSKPKPASSPALIHLDPPIIPQICVKGKLKYDLVALDGTRGSHYTLKFVDGLGLVAYPDTGYTFQPPSSSSTRFVLGYGSDEACGATPTATPTATPSETPTSSPTPTETPTATPTATPTESQEPTPTPTASQTEEPTPTATPTATPTDEPTSSPTATTSPSPTTSPTTPVIVPKASLVVACERDEKGEITGWVEAELTLDNTQRKSEAAFQVKTTWPGDSVNSELFVAAESSETFWAYFPAGGVLRNVVMWKGQVLLDQSDNTQQCVVKDKPKPDKPKPTKPPKSPKPPKHPDKPWNSHKSDRGISKDTGPGEEPMAAAAAASPVVAAMFGGFGLLLVVAGGAVLIFRRRKEV